MAVSPEQGAEGVVRLVLSSDGQALPESVQVLSVLVESLVNRVPMARLVIVDGDMPRQAFPVSDDDHFKPGKRIRVSAGYGSEESPIFEGIVVKQAVRISGENDARLEVECRDAAVKLTVGRRNANHVDMTDGDIITSLVSGAGLEADVESTAFQHPELVQFFCSDWDFLLSRAEANGLLVITTAGKVTVKAPDTSAAPVLKVSYGKDLREFDAELDAATQYASAQAVSWDLGSQAVVQGAEASPASLSSQGDLDSATLAQVIDLPSWRLQSAAPLGHDLLTGWAKALQLKAGLARLRGRMTFQGSARAVVGGLVELEGVGKRFSGTVYATGVTHEIGDGDWSTTVRFGLSPRWFTDTPDVRAPAAAGLLPPVEGLQVGVVMKLDGDPEGQHRIQVSVPVMQAETEGVWARLLNFHGSNGFGSFFLPEVGDEVVLGYFNHDPSHPVILGSLYSSNRVPPYALAAENDTKAIVTRCKSKIEFDEAKKAITVITPGNNRIVLSDEDQSILLQDQNDNQVHLHTGGITLSSPKDIQITAKGGITLDAVSAISIGSKADVKVSGLNVAAEAQVGLTAKGNASAELSAAGQTVVKGAIVMIN